MLPSAPVESSAPGRGVLVLGLALAGGLLSQACVCGGVGADRGGDAGVVSASGLSTQCLSNADCTPVFFGDVCSVTNAEGPTCNGVIATVSVGAYEQEVEAARGRCVQPPPYDGGGCNIPVQVAEYKVCMIVGCDAGTCEAVNVCVI